MSDYTIVQTKTTGPYNSEIQAISRKKKGSNYFVVTCTNGITGEISIEDETDLVDFQPGTEVEFFLVKKYFQKKDRSHSFTVNTLENFRKLLPPQQRYKGVIESKLLDSVTMSASVAMNNMPEGEEFDSEDFVRRASTMYGWIKSTLFNETFEDGSDSEE